MDPKNIFHTIQNYWNSPSWLQKRMLFLSGPRQVGKTTLVTSTLCPSKESYFNWDNRKIRLDYQKDPEFFTNSQSKWICFDEIHKRPRWKDILKGIYDSQKDRYHFVITGSAKLETFKKSGDSLVGRYFHTHLFPLNLPDFHKTNFHLPKDPSQLIQAASDLHDATAMPELLALGGFPEPFFSGSESFWRRWSILHHDLILTEDLRDLSRITEIDKVETLLEILHPCAGQLISYRNLATDLETTHGSIRRWLEMLEKLQLVFSVPPYSKKIRRAYKQDKKWYFMDWGASTNNLFENYIAASLLRATTLYTDRFGEKMTLHFVRTHDGAEVDFLICKNGQPWLLVEAKEGAPDISRAVYRFVDELKVPCIVVTKKTNLYKKIKSPGKQSIYSMSWAKFGQLLP
ncbi:MAG: hypothetical protein A3G32_09780 [Deltaproteobacteria bacterium RIFCSPLOWO2_12_FULL_40_28]|nr:MAG: hypothetical protein A3C45_04215 [Deltaproteobacteria bacterium RIFCSPHIGHO2_02_FULL_40_28]OGQ21076.1 MAG: hypothetical protein A3E27_00120 [Deltaproteobacteria bacterium RIFCSPHIGHO2_12_FULL_40_32]OGQ38988.1 MAG: hypothetical protein A3I69_07650 [Deltaproteobacteria bacterium RIFCSPLOWO2_02_FULL_40_36]OGQ53042.1 MAG: hypothetical protein A3G32_09780 [Deltaproteobacteria bacterium RIFCSPLOWO2_12_FULL_40_28]